MSLDMDKTQNVENALVDIFHFLALFVIGATVVWSAVYEYLQIMNKGYASLKDILLLFIYLELGGMIGVYFKTHILPTCAVFDIYHSFKASAYRCETGIRFNFTCIYFWVYQAR